MVYQLKQPQEAVSLFEGWHETMIWSCLQGVMGCIYADSRTHPASARAVLGDFHYFAGKPDKELLLYQLPAPGMCPPSCERRDFGIFVPGHEGWAELIKECFAQKAVKVLRYAFRKDICGRKSFDVKMLQEAARNVPDGFELRMMDEALFMKCRETAWCRDWAAQYEDYAQYRRYGLGAVLLKDGEPVSGASSYSGFCGGIEIEIDTRKDWRRRGFAFLCGARLILECLDRGWYPAWDAQNRQSAALACRLGYQPDGTYEAYEVTSGKAAGVHEPE